MKLRWVEQYLQNPLSFREFLTANEVGEAVKAFDTIPVQAYVYDALIDIRVGIVEIVSF